MTDDTNENSPNKSQNVNSRDTSPENKENLEKDDDINLVDLVENSMDNNDVKIESGKSTHPLFTSPKKKNGVKSNGTPNQSPMKKNGVKSNGTPNQSPMKKNGLKNASQNSPTKSIKVKTNLEKALNGVKNTEKTQNGATKNTESLQDDPQEELEEVQTSDISEVFKNILIELKSCDEKWALLELEEQDPLDRILELSNSEIDELIRRGLHFCR